MSDSVAQVILRMKDEASAPAKAIAGEVAHLDQVAEEAGDSLNRASRSTANVSDVAGKAGSSVAKLAGAAGMLSPQLAQVALGAADLFDVLEVGGPLATSLGISLGSILAVAGPVAVAVAAMAAAWYYFNSQVEAAEAKNAAAVKRLEETQKLTDLVTEAKRREAEAVGGQTALDAQAAAVKEKWNQALQESTKTIQEERKALAESLVQEKAYVSQGLLSHVEDVDRLTRALAQKDRELKSNAKAAERGAQAELDAAEATRLRAEADAQAAAAAQARAKAEAELQAVLAKAQGVGEKGSRMNLSPEMQAVQGAQDLLDDATATLEKAGITGERAALMLRPYIDNLERAAEAARVAAIQAEADTFATQEWAPSVQGVSSAYAELSGSLDALIPSDTLTDMDRLVLAQADYAIALSRGALSADEQAAALLKLQEAQEAVNKAQADASLQSATKGVSVATGGPSSALSAVGNAGPWGAIIAAIVGALEEGVASIGDLFDNFTSSVQDAIKTLPEELGKNIGKWLETAIESVDIVSSFVQSLADHFDEILEGIAGSIGPLIAAIIKEVLNAPSLLTDLLEGIFSQDGWLDAGKALMKGFTSMSGMFADSSGNVTGESVGTSLGDFFTGGLSTNIIDYAGSHASGSSWIPRTGWAYVHAGERITPSSGASTGTTARYDRGGGRGRSANVTIRAGIVDARAAKDIIRQLRPYLGDAGLGLRLPAGSVEG